MIERMGLRMVWFLRLGVVWDVLEYVRGGLRVEAVRRSEDSADGWSCMPIVSGTEREAGICTIRRKTYELRSGWEGLCEPDRFRVEKTMHGFDDWIPN